MGCKPMPRDPVTFGLAPPGAGIECHGIPVRRPSLPALAVLVAALLALVTASPA
jgi:hypothetical protein